jgi:hypothetical protein
VLCRALGDRLPKPTATAEPGSGPATKAEGPAE